MLMSEVRENKPILQEVRGIHVHDEVRGVIPNPHKENQYETVGPFYMSLNLFL